jgi:3-isopropylmalate/(R)-2-methylmalate dehydratase large subunit
MSTEAKTLFDKIWDAHVVTQQEGGPVVLYVDLHLIHEVTSPQAFAMLRERGLTVRRPERTVATMDHATPTQGDGLALADALAVRQLRQLATNCREFGIRLYDMESERRGIVHVIGPELGLSRPGMTIVCGDSHTSTHGAVGALAFGIGTSEVAHVLASQCLLQYRPKTFLVRFEGRLQPGVTAKDMILALIAHIGIGGGTGHVFEYAGPAVRRLTMEARMTLCNMSIEGGARAGLVAPDDTTFHYVAGRPFAPQGEAWEEALERWRALPSDPGAIYDRTVTIDVSELEPMITYGTNPGMGVPITRPVPDPEQVTDAGARASLQKALDYMALRPGRPLLGHKVDVVFIGSCTNARLSDLREAARLLGNGAAPGGSGGAGPRLHHGRGRVAPERLLDVPGDERRPAGAGPVRGQHQQPQF